MGTFLEAGTDAAYLADIFEKLENDTADGATGWPVISQAFTDQVRGDLAKKNITRVISLTNRLASILNRETLRGVAEDAWREVAASSDIAYEQAHGGDFAGVLKAIYDGMVLNGYTIQGPGDTYAPFTANGNVEPTSGAAIVGDGFVDRLTVDENDFPLIGWAPSTYKLTCSHDSSQPSVARFRELFKLTSVPAYSSNLKLQGSGLTVNKINCLDEIVAALFIRNPNWQEDTGPLAPGTGLTGWKFDTGTPGTEVNLDTTTANAYRVLTGQLARSLTVTGNFEISADLDNGGILPSLNEHSPYWWGLPIMRTTTETGTMEIRFSPTSGSGGVATTVDVSTLGTGVWTWLKLPMAKESWAARMGLPGAIPRIKLTGFTGTALRVGGNVFGPMTRVGARESLLQGRGALGQYVAIVAGRTPWQKGDQHRAIDTPGTRAKLHQWQCYEPRLFYCPSATSTPTIADRP